MAAAPRAAAPKAPEPSQSWNRTRPPNPARRSGTEHAGSARSAERARRAQWPPESRVGSERGDCIGVGAQLGAQSVDHGNRLVQRTLGLIDQLGGRAGLVQLGFQQRRAGLEVFDERA